MNYEATIEDPKVFSRPWKISMPLYRRQEKNAQLMEYKCVPFAEELMYGHLASGRAVTNRGTSRVRGVEDLSDSEAVFDRRIYLKVIRGFEIDSPIKYRLKA